jgi:TRAP-type mannitol/chloroaromatic compound transport system permease large subunit
MPKGKVATQFLVSLLPALAILALLGYMYASTTAPQAAVDTSGLVEAGGAMAAASDMPAETGGLQEPAADSGGVQEPPAAGGTLQEPPAEGAKDGAAAPAPATAAPKAVAAAKATAPVEEAAARVPAPTWYWIVFGLGMAGLVLVSVMMNWQRLEIFKMLLASFFPLAIMILGVLGSIVFGLATPTEAAAVGGFGGILLAAAYRYLAIRQAKNGNAVLKTVGELGGIIKESAFLTAKTSAMVCWLFVGSSIFSASFALLGGQAIIEAWVLSLGLTTVQFMLLSQFIIFILGWPLEWTEIIVIFMPIFIPLLAKFNVDPLFFGLLVALNLQTAFLSPPVAMAAFYLKGVSPKHVTLNQIFAGMMPFMGIQVLAIFLLYMFPGIGMWLPNLLYK